MYTKCSYCPEAAIAYCDFVVDVSRAMTCDRTVCLVHRERVGDICDRTKRKHGHETIDHCIYHRPPEDDGN